MATTNVVTLNDFRRSAFDPAAGQRIAAAVDQRRKITPAFSERDLLRELQEAALRPVVAPQTAKPPARPAEAAAVRVSPPAPKPTTAPRSGNVAEFPKRRMDCARQRVAITTIRGIDGSVTREQQTAYEVFIRAKPGHMRGGYALVAAISDHLLGKKPASAIREAADVVLNNLEDGVVVGSGDDAA